MGHLEITEEHMNRQYTRIDLVREILDKDLKAISDEEVKRCAYVHLYGVGQAAAFIAMKRGHSRKYAELAETAGMLHDYTKYVYNESENHAEKSAICAREILKNISEYTDEDIELVYKAIYNHSNKKQRQDVLDEILKDADEMQHYFRNPMEDYWLQKERTQTLLNEFGIEI